MRLTQAADGGIETVLERLQATFVEAIPRLATAVVFLAAAYVLVRLAVSAVRSALGRVYADDERLIADLLASVVGVFLWFGVALALLKILGMGEIAASLGTATGFVALGVSYALSDMIADTVAGVYLLRDPDFQPGDRVVAGDVSGVVRAIDLRKTRLETDEGDLVVLGNSSVEEKWTKKAAASDPGESTAEAADGTTE
ncbi:mechanosensitive ion channel protein MscS [Halobacteriales archaeon QS_1_67_19]|nr:MAG: mechanosensitive ion channel protein MscS [Halobacteriales archaeon QS_1_67_19]